MSFQTALPWFVYGWLKFQLLRIFHGVSLSLLLAVLVGLGMIFNSTIDNHPLKFTQLKVGWVSMKAEKIWTALGKRGVTQARIEREAFRKLFLQSRERLKMKGALPGLDESGLLLHGTYQHLPEVYADQESGAIFPMPVVAPHRSSWYQTSLLVLRFLQLLHQARSDLLKIHVKIHSPLSGPNPDSMTRQRENFEKITSSWNELNTQFEILAEQLRYLEAWIPSLEAEYSRERGQGGAPRSISLIEAFFRPESESFPKLSELLKPRRILGPSFLPDDLDDIPAGLVIIPITTDVTNRRFLSEVEGAVDVHWNRSSWATKKKISFHIQWQFLTPNSKFSNGTETLEQHLRHFPQDRAIMTTGGLNTHVVTHFENDVRNSALVLGPGRVTPRTLAHEIGHLMGFPDCYTRTLSGQGIFGVAVLEWDNPFYPDDLMCDNLVGEPRVEVW